MKLASLEGGREGRLVVVSDDMGWCVSAAEIAPTLRGALADWSRCEPLLRGVAAFLNRGAQRYVRFEPTACASPLPSDPDMTRSRGQFSAMNGMELRRGGAVIVGALAKGAGRAEAIAAIRLAVLQVSRPDGAAQSPVAVTTESLGEAWRDGRLSGGPSLELDGSLASDAPIVFDFANAIVEAARAGDIAEGSVISLAEHRPLRLGAIGEGAVLRYELRDALSRSTFGAVQLRAKVAAEMKEVA